MRSNESDKSGEPTRVPGDLPGDATSSDAAAPRTDDNPQGREFAQRALASLITDLRNRQGVLDPGRIASTLGMSVTELAECAGLSQEQLKKPMSPEEHEDILEPFAAVIAIVRDAYGDDDKRLRLWLRTPRPELDGKTPYETFFVAGGVQRVVMFVLGAWLGNAD
jgi:hypothetical protein